MIYVNNCKYIERERERERERENRFYIYIYCITEYHRLQIPPLRDDHLQMRQDAGISSERRKEMDARHAKISWYEQLFQEPT